MVAITGRVVLLPGRADLPRVSVWNSLTSEERELVGAANGGPESLRTRKIL
jgi:hypothetical protein